MASMSLVGDPERDRAAASLRRHYLQGRLTLEELSDRVAAALSARSRADLRSALSGLPPAWPDLREPAAAATRTLARAATFVALAGLWAFLSLVLLVAYAFVALLGDVSTTGTIVFLLLWAAVTYGTWRAWQRGGRRA
jgi:uncharacterized protein DUF1707